MPEQDEKATATGQAGAGAPASVPPVPSGMKRLKVNRDLAVPGSVVVIGEGANAQTFTVNDDLTVDIPASISNGELWERIFPGVGTKK